MSPPSLCLPSTAWREGEGGWLGDSFTRFHRIALLLSQRPRSMPGLVVPPGLLINRNEVLRS